MSVTNINVTGTGVQTAFNKPYSDNSLMLQLSGTYSGLTFTIEGSVDGVNYAQIGVLDFASLQITPGGTSISPTDNTVRLFRVPAENLINVRLNVSAYTSGTMAVNSQSGFYAGGVFSQALIQNTTNTGNSSTTGTITGTSASASALTVGRQGATNPVLQVDASTSTVVTGIKVKGAASGAGVAVSAISSAGAENLTIDALGTGTIGLGTVSTGAITLGTAVTCSSTLGVSGAVTGTSTSASALTVGRQGATNPVLKVDASTATVVTGILIKGAAAAAGCAVSVITSGTNENLTIDAASAGTITLAGTSTGTVTIGSSLTMSTKNIITDTSTGTKIGTATTQKLGFFNATPVVQPVASSDTTTGAAGSTTTVFLNTTFTGLAGTAAYTVGGMITSLKALGLLAP